MRRVLAVVQKECAERPWTTHDGIMWWVYRRFYAVLTSPKRLAFWGDIRTRSLAIQRRGKALADFQHVGSTNIRITDDPVHQACQRASLVSYRVAVGH